MTPPRPEAAALAAPAEPALPAPGARSLTARLVLVAALGALPVLALVGAILLWLFSERIESRFDAFLTAYQQQLIAGAELEADGTVQLRAQPADPRFDLPFSGWYWQVNEGDRTLAQSASAGPLQGSDGLPISSFDGAVDWIGPADTKQRAVARTVRLPGSDTPLRVVVMGPHAEIDQEVLAFGIQLALALGGLGIAFLLATALQVRYGLLPLGALRAALQAVRKGTAPRLAGDYPREVAPLVDELNEVLAHNEALIARARVQAGNLAHGLKSPLT